MRKRWRKKRYMREFLTGKLSDKTRKALIKDLRKAGVRPAGGNLERDFGDYDEGLMELWLYHFNPELDEPGCLLPEGGFDG